MVLFWRNHESPTRWSRLRREPFHPLPIWLAAERRARDGAGGVQCGGGNRGGGERRSGCRFSRVVDLLSGQGEGVSCAGTGNQVAGSEETCRGGRALRVVRGGGVAGESSGDRHRGDS